MLSFAKIIIVCDLIVNFDFKHDLSQCWSWVGLDSKVPGKRVDNNSLNNTFLIYLIQEFNRRL